MGHSSDRLAAVWGVSRREQDEFAQRSHVLAARATAGGLLRDELTPTAGLAADNGIKADSNLDKLASLKPAFVKPHGTHTAGNSSFLTDGASAALLMGEAAALAGGFTPRARLADWIFVSQDPRDELLLGPAYAIARLLARRGLRVGDVGVWELHEAFAGQLLANLNAMDSATFAGRALGAGAAKVGRPDIDVVNTCGGSLALGHPFGATGTRLLTTAANRMHREGARFALLAACAAGGQGHAMLLERYDAPPGTGAGAAGGASVKQQQQQQQQPVQAPPKAA
jgi:acetyl-CoA acyltransferase